jgi:hypothetical protein
MHIKSDSQRGLSAEVGLRPDSDVMMVTIEKSASLFKISRWNGFVFKDKPTWDGPGKMIPADVAEQQTLNLLGQKLSVAIFHVKTNIILLYFFYFMIKNMLIINFHIKYI